MADLRVNLFGKQLAGPVIAASGTFGFGPEYAGIEDLRMLGGISGKGLTLNGQPGNDGERLLETPSGLMNSIGLQNPGVQHFIDVELGEMLELKQKYGTVAIANLGGHSEEEYVEGAAMLSESGVDIVELNISCPNVHAGGKNFGCDPRAAAEVTRAVKAVTKKPVFMKLTPNVTDITEIARACADAGADGICLINTLLGMRIDLKSRRPLLANRTGGLSGPAVFPVAVRMVWDVYEAVKLPIIGCGGVSSAEDVCEMMMAGATAVEVGAANLRDPYACKTIVEQLPRVCEQLGAARIAELTGAAHR